MKKKILLFFLLMLLVIPTGCNKTANKQFLSENTVTINGKNISGGFGEAKKSDTVDGTNGGKTTYLSYDGFMHTVIDSDTVIQNNFVITGSNVTGPFDAKIGDSASKLKERLMDVVDEEIEYNGTSSLFYSYYFKDTNKSNYVSTGGNLGENIVLELFKFDNNDSGQVVKTITVTYTVSADKINSISINVVENK